MAIPQSLSRKLRETLGDDAGGDLVTWWEEEREERVQLREELRAMETRLAARMDRLELTISDVQSNLMKWSFVFWCGVAAVAALAGVLRGS